MIPDLERMSNLGKGDPIAAVRECEAAIVANPCSADLWTLLGRLHLASQTPLRAETAFERAIELSPGGAARRYLAELKLARGRPSEAIALLQGTPDRPSRAKRRAAWWATLLINIGDFEAAIVKLDEALSAQPDPALAVLRETAQAGLEADRNAGLSAKAKRRYLAGLESLVQGEPAKAAFQFEEVTRLAPAFAPAWAGLKGAIELLGQNDLPLASVPKQVRPVLARRRGGRGLVFDPRDRFPVRTRSEVLTEVRSVAELQTVQNAWFTLGPGGASVVAGPSIALGGPADGFRHTYRTSETFVAALSDAAVVGRGQVITASGELVSELRSHVTTQKYGLRIDDDVGIFDPRPFRDGFCDVRVFDKPAFLMSGPTDAGFGDWMVNFLPRIAIAAKAGLDVDFLVRANGGVFVGQTLEALGIEASRVIHHDPSTISVFPRLYVPGWPMPNRVTAIDGHLSSLAVANFQTAPGFDRRVYMSREYMTQRPLTNEAQVRALFEARGFVTVYPEQQSSGALRAILQGASHVAGGYGSAWLNLALGRHKPACMILMPPYHAGFLKEVSIWLTGMGAPFGLFLGSEEKSFGDHGDTRRLNAPWCADLDRLGTSIDQFLNWDCSGQWKGALITSSK